MTTKVTALLRRGLLQPEKQPLAAPWPTPCRTTEERLQRIRAMGEQIQTYVDFICRVGDLNGNSAEAKANAVLAFYVRMIAAERELALVQENLKLG